MDQSDTLARAQEAFILYGYRKASMDGIARSIGVSRQALYNRFGSKAGLFEAMAQHAVDESAAAAHASLSDRSKSLSERLLGAFDAWAGQYVTALRSSPNAHEVLDAAGAIGGNVTKKAEQATRAALVKALDGERTSRSASNADVAATLHIASKGLFFTAKDRADFRRRMKLVIRVVLGS